MMSSKHKFPLIKRKRGIIIACDVYKLEELKQLVNATDEFQEVCAYKIGFTLGLTYGLPAVVNTIRKYSDKPIIYDHQKAATDIPDTSENFMNVCADAKVDSVILFPFTGKQTEKVWIAAAKQRDLQVIVGGSMTHKGFEDYFRQEAIIEIYKNAIKEGVTDFVVPSTKPELTRTIVEVVKNEGVQTPQFYSPGIGKQGGNLVELHRATKGNWYAIIGQTIYRSSNMKERTKEIIEEYSTLLKK